MGDRSAYSNVVVYPDDELIPHITGSWGVVETPDGSIYVVNGEVATIYGADSKGGLKGLFDSIRMEGVPHGTVTCIATDDEGTLLYVPNPKGNYIYRVDPARGELLENLACVAFKAPRGIALGPDGNLYVSDTGNNKIHIITKTGEHLGSFGGPDVFASPRNVYVDKNSLVYVVDCLRTPKEGDRSPGKVIVFKKASPNEWQFEPILTIDGFPGPECVVADGEGRIYIGAFDGIYAYDEKGGLQAHWVCKLYGTPMGGATVFGLAWSRNGDLLVTQGSTLRRLIRVTQDEILAARNPEN
jgi:DNA-binding beta-propeller fold protein YncE